MKLKGLSCDIYRSADGYDCTAGGASSRVKSVVLVSSHYPVFEADEKHPAFSVVERVINGNHYRHLEPVKMNDAGHLEFESGVMFGGNFAYSNDSRWKAITGTPYPLPIHDRIEKPDDRTED